MRPVGTVRERFTTLGMTTGSAGMACDFAQPDPHTRADWRWGVLGRKLHTKEHHEDAKYSAYTHEFCEYPCKRSEPGREI